MQRFFSGNGTDTDQEFEQQKWPIRTWRAFSPFVSLNIFGFHPETFSFQDVFDNGRGPHPIFYSLSGMIFSSLYVWFLPYVVSQLLSAHALKHTLLL